MIPNVEVSNACYNTSEHGTLLPGPCHIFDRLKDSGIMVLAETCHEIGMTSPQKPSEKTA